MLKKMGGIMLQQPPEAKPEKGVFPALKRPSTSVPAYLMPVYGFVTLSKRRPTTQIGCYHAYQLRPNLVTARS